ncbi:c-type cytochrome [Jiella marina]|uniref:c-type cytochrome n=1 Tax=Jiella sp. LLJ827 TaxID=2917712 RepID=UPI0021006924|nr:cytochrome c [Jiella sp. LLJ827]MCQ0989302.1 cytochrome c [Jiella sp. LLJ827]
MSKFLDRAFTVALVSAALALPAIAGDSTRMKGVESASVPSGEGAGEHFGLGREATQEEIAAWNIDVRPDGEGLPEGSGTVARGEEIFTEQCAVCHGDFGEGRDRWPQLAGGFDTLTRERPVKTVGSYWPYLSTVYDYVHRAMPFGNSQSLSNDDVYALAAYILYLNDIETDEDFELSKKNFTTITMPNAGEFVADNRAEEQHYKDDRDPCMKDCKSGPVEVTMHAQVLDVTPDAGGEEGPGGGNVD